MIIVQLFDSILLIGSSLVLFRHTWVQYTLSVREPNCTPTFAHTSAIQTSQVTLLDFEKFVVRQQLRTRQVQLLQSPVVTLVARFSSLLMDVQIGQTVLDTMPANIITDQRLCIFTIFAKRCFLAVLQKFLKELYSRQKAEK